MNGTEFNFIWGFCSGSIATSLALLVWTVAVKISTDRQDRERWLAGESKHG